MGFLSGIIGGVGSIVGGLLGKSSSDKATDTNAALSHEQLEFQKDYVKNRLQWQVDDAKKAGLHPMVAANISPTSFSPVSTNVASPTDYSWVGDVGQNLGYAATKAKDRIQQGQMFNLTKRGLELDNEYKQAQIDQLKVDTLASSIAANQAFRSPAAPSVHSLGVIDGQSDSVLVTPSEIKASSSTGTQAGAPPAVQWFQNPDGSVVRSMSEQAKNVNEDDVINTIGWHIDNNVIPLVGRYGYPNAGRPDDYTPPLSMLPKGAVGWLLDGYNKFRPVYDYSRRDAYYGPLE